MERCYPCSTEGDMRRNASMTPRKASSASNSLGTLSINYYKGKTQGLCKKYVITSFSELPEGKHLTNVQTNYSQYPVIYRKK